VHKPLQRRADPAGGPPRWAFDSFRMFNARAEGAGDKPAFRRLVDRQR
jgi:putative SOS response-associated peptidase YedK